MSLIEQLKNRLLSPRKRKRIEQESSFIPPRQTIIPTGILSPEKTGSLLDLTHQMKDFPFEKELIERIGISPELMRWELQKVTIIGENACLFLTLYPSHPNINAIRFSVDRNEQDEMPVFFSFCNPEGEPGRQFRLGTLVVYDRKAVQPIENRFFFYSPQSPPPYRLETSKIELIDTPYKYEFRSEASLIDSRGQVYRYSPSFPKIANAGGLENQRPIFSVIISLPDRFTNRARIEAPQVFSFLPPFGEQIWNHLRSKSEFWEILNR